jgi:hypothetical protein
MSELREIEDGDDDNAPENLFEMVAADEFERAQLRFETHPEEAKFIDGATGRTVLHLLCNGADSPRDLFTKVLRCFPEATKLQEKKYGATPLHALCWSSQRSMDRVQILLEYMDEESLLIRNWLGGTALHSACGSHAWLPVIKLLVHKSPSLLLQRTQDYNHTALTALWHSHLQSIPGHMAIARILEGEQVNDGHFCRFWEKVEFVVCESYRLCPQCPKQQVDEASFKLYLLHGLINLRAPLNIMKVALKINPAFAAQVDADGNYPLHHVVIRRPFRIKDIEILSVLIAAYPEAASKRNHEGQAPIFIALRDRMGWEEGLEVIVKADTEILASTDTETRLYPFLLAACADGRVAVNSTYNLLCAKPHLIKEGIKIEP